MRHFVFALALLVGCGASSTAAPEHTSADHTSAEHTSAEHTSADHTSADHTSAEPTPAATPPSVVVETLSAPPAPSEQGAPVRFRPWPHAVPQAPDEPMQVVAAVDDGPLVLIGRDHIYRVRGDGRTPTLAAPRDPSHTTSSQAQPSRAGYHASGTVVLRSLTGLAGYDAETLQPRWTYERPDGVGFAVLSSGDMFVLAVHPSRTLVGLDPATGEQRWSQERRWQPGPPSAEPLLAARGVVVVLEGERLVGLVAATGEERWRLEVAAESSLVAAHERHLALREGSALRVIDLDDGHVEAQLRFPEAPTGTWAALDDTRLYVLDAARLARRASVRSVAWRGGGSPWVSEPFSVQPFTTAVPFLMADADALYVCSGLGTRALASDTGQLVWRDAANGCAPRSWRPRPRVPRVLFLADRSVGDPLVALERRASAPPMRELTVEGAVRCMGQPRANAAVLLGDELIETNRRGEFRATAQTGGALRVTAVMGSGCDNAEQVVDASGRVEFEQPTGSSDGL